MSLTKINKIQYNIHTFQKNLQNYPNTIYQLRKLVSFFFNIMKEYRDNKYTFVKIISAK